MKNFSSKGSVKTKEIINNMNSLTVILMIYF